MRFLPSVVLPICAALLLGSCKNETEPWLFERVSSTHSGVHFINTVKNTRDFNIFLYRNFYNGGGVAIGDINNDGLADIFFTSNMGGNTLYINKDDFVFEDITEMAGIASKNKWSTGVVMVDINADGLLDIYVCNAGYRKGANQRNELYINNGDLTFTNRASEYGLDENGYGTHAAFFDYDKDGDLDMYLLNNSFMPVNTLNYSNKRELPASEWPVRDYLKGGGDKLFRNHNGRFIDVTATSGIYNSLIGFGLGITVGDVNGDNWEDMYISNDFFERDYLYINQKDGTFREAIKEYMKHISAFSMGADMADINNDTRPEIFVTDMLPDDEYRLKTTTAFEPYSVYDLKLKRDFYHQYMQNTLQLNTGHQAFSEIAHYSGVSSSDWSWGALMFDADNDGYRDIYVCNGIYHDVTDQDFIDFFANDVIQKMALDGNSRDISNIIAKMPSTPLKNKLFINQGNLKFKDISGHAANEPSFSNGAAYGDLDNDGDQDLVTNNVNQEAFIYKNMSRERTGHHYIKIILEGEGGNTKAIGAKVFLYRNNEVQSAQLIPSRGFQSSVDYPVLFGLGGSKQIDSIRVVWPDLSVTTNVAPAADTILYIEKNTAIIEQAAAIPQVVRRPYMYEIATSMKAHKEDDFVDFYREGLTIKMTSREGPCAGVADVNGDGREDIYIGGAYHQEGQLYLQTADGFVPSEQQAFRSAVRFEDTAVRFFDADQDQDVDLFVGSGGNHDYPGSAAMQDRLYLNDGRGGFELFPEAFPNNGFNTAVAVPFDIDNDGDLDLFVGSRSVPGNYGSSPRSYLYENMGNASFKDVTRTRAPELQYAGMITDAVMADVAGDHHEELVLTGEWMSPLIFEIEKGRLVALENSLLEYGGWWYTVVAEDVDHDGDNDLILGNRGENFYFTGTKEAPAKLWVYDFDGNGTIENIITRSIGGRDIPVHLKKELTSQIVSLKKQNLKHSEYAGKSIQQLFQPEILKKAAIKKATYFKSSVAINDGNGSFRLIPLPGEMQFSSINCIYPTDVDGDELTDLVMGGNHSGFLPQYSRLDAGYGQTLINRGEGKFEVLHAAKSGFFLGGDIRKMKRININGEEHFLVTVNNDSPRIFKVGNKNTMDYVW